MKIKIQQDDQMEGWNQGLVGLLRVGRSHVWDGIIVQCDPLRKAGVFHMNQVIHFTDEKIEAQRVTQRERGKAKI